MKIFYILRVVDLIFLSIVFFIVLLILAFTDTLSEEFVIFFSRSEIVDRSYKMSHYNREEYEHMLDFVMKFAEQFFVSLIVSFFLITLLFHLFCFFVTHQVKSKYQNVRAGLHGAYHIPNVPEKDFDELAAQHIPLA